MDSGAPQQDMAPPPADHDPASRVAPAAAPTVPAPDLGGAASPLRGPAGAMPRGTIRVSSEHLFAGATELQIEHRGAVYRLKQTSLGKLILTK